MQRMPWEEDWTHPQGGGYPTITTQRDPRQVASDARASASESREQTRFDERNKPNLPAGYMWGPDGKTAVRVPGLPPDKATEAKLLSEGASQRLDDAVSLYGQLKAAVSSFDDGYGGNLLGGAENALQSVNSGLGTPGQKDWWSNFKAVDNQVRNKLFGASLSGGEKSAYGETTVSPTEDPSIIRDNLQRRLEAARSELERRVGSLRAAGYNTDQIDASVGEYGQDFQKGFKLPDYRKQTPASASETSNPGQWQFNDERRATPVDGMPKLSAADEAYIAQNARYMSPQGMEQWYKDKGQPLPAGNAQKVYDYYQKGGRDNPAINYDEKAYRAQLEEANKRKPLPGYTDLFQNGFTAGGLPILAGLGGGVASSLAGEGFSNGYSFNRDASRLALENLRNDTGIPGMVAEGAGMVGGSLGLERGLAATLPRAFGALPGGARSLTSDVTFGGLYGGNEAAPGDYLGGFTRGAATAGAGNATGQIAGQVAGGVAAGINSPASRRLYNAGVRVTPGQAFRNRRGMFGRMVTNLEDAATSIPGVGDVINARRVEGLEDANRAAFGRAGDPIGAQATAYGREGLASLDNAVTQAYDASLKPMRLSVDPKLDTDLRAAYSAGRSAQNPVVAGAVKDSYDSSIYPFIDGNGVVTGDGLQAIKQGTAIDRGDLKGIPGGKIGRDAITDARDAFFSLAERQDPVNFAGYRSADEAYGNYMALQRAVNASSGRPGDAGLFTGAQLANASKARGKYPENTTLTPFAQDMVDVLPSQTPDSGTGRRIATQIAGAAIGAGATGAAGYYLDPASAAIVAGAMLPFTKPGNRMTSALLLADRPAAIERIGEGLKRKSGRIGMFASPLALEYNR